MKNVQDIVFFFCGLNRLERFERSLEGVSHTDVANNQELVQDSCFYVGIWVKEVTQIQILMNDGV